MKVIDLLNKIAKGEQPKHIRVYDEDWYWNDYDGYVTKWSLSTTPDAQHYLFSQYRLDFVLNKEIEVIEDNKKIEKISWKEKESLAGFIRNDNDKLDILARRTEKLKKSLNEIIEVLNDKN